MRKQIKAWLKAAVLSEEKLDFPTAGTPQGGVISPLLSNIALHGLEKHLKQCLITLDLKSKTGTNLNTESKRTSLAVVRYADDFVILHKDREVIVKAKEKVETWLSHLNLELKGSKTRIAHSDIGDGCEAPGFNFLGFHIRKYPFGKYRQGSSGLESKTLIKPAKDSIKNHLHNIKLKLKVSSTTEVLINNLNPIIKGWCNYYKTVTSKQTFSICRKRLYDMLIAWGIRKHSTRTKAWVYEKYFLKKNQKRVFAYERDGQLVSLITHDTLKIVRHVKVQGTRSPFDGDISYWSFRLQKHMGLSRQMQSLLRKQKGLCALCELPLSTTDILEVDHKVPKFKGGTNSYENLQVLHGHCHDIKHSADEKLNHEEPYETRVSRTVLN